MLSNLYNPPNSQLNNNTHIKLKPKRVILGKALCFLSLLIVFITADSLTGYYDIYKILQQMMASNVQDPRIVAGDISIVLVSMMQTMILAFPSFIFTLLSIFLTSYRSHFYFNLWVIVTTFMFIVVPIGTFYSLILATVLYVKRREFKK